MSISTMLTVFDVGADRRRLTVLGLFENHRLRKGCAAGRDAAATTSRGAGDNARPHGGESRRGRQARASGRDSALVIRKRDTNTPTESHQPNWKSQLG